MVNKALIEKIKSKHPDVTIVMASKYLDAKDYQAFIDAGIKDFGDSRVAAFIEKYPKLKHYPIRHHFLGTLQTKKVKKCINHIDCLHSLDRLKLAKEIQKRRKTPLPCFIQVNISKEDQKHGVAFSHTAEFLNQLQAYDKVDVIGLMGMAELTDDHEKIAAQFETLKTLFHQLKKDSPKIKYLSMGMSNDYPIALEKGATHLRLGRVLLGG